MHVYVIICGGMLGSRYSKESFHCIYLQSQVVVILIFMELVLEDLHSLGRLMFSMMRMMYSRHPFLRPQMAHMKVFLHFTHHKPPQRLAYVQLHVTTCALTVCNNRLFIVLSVL